MARMERGDDNQDAVVAVAEEEEQRRRDSSSSCPHHHHHDCDYDDSRGCLETSVRCSCLCCMACGSAVRAGCCYGTLQNPPEWTRSYAVLTAILRSIAYNAPPTIGCLRALTSGDVPISWCPKELRILPTPPDCPVRGEWIVPKDMMMMMDDNNDSNSQTPIRPPRHVMLYLHGGAFALCSPGTHRGLTTRLLQAALQHGMTDLALFVLDYRRPPEHRYPVPVQDCVAAYQWLLEFLMMVNNEEQENNYNQQSSSTVKTTTTNKDHATTACAAAAAAAAQRILLAGDSAGGSLVLLTLAALQQQQQQQHYVTTMPLPAGGMLLSPWIDPPDTSSDSWVRNARYDYLPAHVARRLAATFVSTESDWEEEGALPANVSCEGFPPLLVMVGQYEVLHDQVRAFCDANNNKNNVECVVEPGMVHAYVAFADCFDKERTDAWFGTMMGFVQRVLVKSGDDDDGGNKKKEASNSEDGASQMELGETNEKNEGQVVKSSLTTTTTTQAVFSNSLDWLRRQRPGESWMAGRLRHRQSLVVERPNDQ